MDKVIESGLAFKARIETILEKGIEAYKTLKLTEMQAKAQIVHDAIECISTPLYAVRDSAQDMVKVGSHFQCDNSTVFLIEKANGTFCYFDPIKIEIDKERIKKEGSISTAIYKNFEKIGEQVKDFAAQAHNAMVEKGMDQAQAWIAVSSLLLDTVAKPVYVMRDELEGMKPCEWVDDSGTKWIAKEITEKVVKFRRTTYIRTKIGMLDGNSSSGRLSIVKANELGYTVINNK